MGVRELSYCGVLYYNQQSDIYISVSCKNFYPLTGSDSNVRCNELGTRGSGETFSKLMYTDRLRIDVYS